jgi:transposase InsO family protein
VLDRSFEAAAPNRKRIADFTYVWTAEGWLYVAAVVDLFSRRVVGWAANIKRVYRLYRELGLQLRNKTPKRRVKAKLREG